MTPDQKWVIKGLNVDWIPQPVLGRVDVAMRSDGRFGIADPLVWPQVASSRQPHLVMIPRRPLPSHPAAVLWENVQPADFEPVNDDPQGSHYGRLTQSVLDRQERAASSLEKPVQDCLLGFHTRIQLLAAQEKAARQPGVRQVHARDRAALETKVSRLRELHAKLSLAVDMFRVPSTLRDASSQRGHLHRCFAELWAWLEWDRSGPARIQPPQGDVPRLHSGLDGQGVMGAITAEVPAASALYLAGAPAWLLVRAVTTSPASAAPLRLTEPTPLPATPTEIMPHAGRSALAGAEHLAAIWGCSQSVLDIERIPLPAEHQLPVPAVAATSSVRAPRRGPRKFLHTMI